MRRSEKNGTIGTPGIRRAGVAVVATAGLLLPAVVAAQCLENLALATTPAQPVAGRPVTVAISGSYEPCAPRAVDQWYLLDGELVIHATAPEGCTLVVGSGIVDLEVTLDGPAPGDYAVRLEIAGDDEACSYPGLGFSVLAAKAPTAGGAATLLYPYFEVDLADPQGPSTAIAVGNVDAAAVVAHVTVWTDWGVPSYSFDLPLDGHAVATFNLRQLFAGTLPDAGAYAALPDCGDPVVAPPLDAEVRARLRAWHTGEPSPADGLCAGSGRRGPDVATGYVTIDAAERCVGASLVTPYDRGYFDNGLIDPPFFVGSERNALYGDLLFIDPAGDRVEALEAVGALAHAHLGEETTETFYGGLTGNGGIDDRVPLSSRWKTRFLRGGGFEPTTDLLLWRSGPALPVPIACDAAAAMKLTPCFDERAAVVTVRDERAEVVGTTEIDLGPPLVTGLYEVGGDAIPTSVPFGTVEVETVTRGCLGDPYPLQSYVGALTEAQGRFGFAFRGVPLD